jgi:hypothetical protein
MFIYIYISHGIIGFLNPSPCETVEFHVFQWMEILSDHSAGAERHFVSSVG